MDLERREGAGRALDQSATSLNEVEDVHGSVRVVWDPLGEPVTARLEETQLV